MGLDVATTKGRSAMTEVMEVTDGAEHLPQGCSLNWPVNVLKLRLYNRPELLGPAPEGGNPVPDQNRSHLRVVGSPHMFRCGRE